MPLPLNPILVVSYSDETRADLVSTLNKSGVAASPCATFCEAENLALKGLYNGLLVDLPSMIKSKGEEKIVAYTLANYFPTLRVRTMGSMLVPMAMPGSVKQDSNLVDFLSRTCSQFSPRTLRAHRRHQICVSTLLYCMGEEHRGFTMDISWGGLSSRMFFRNGSTAKPLPRFCFWKEISLLTLPFVGSNHGEPVLRPASASVFPS